MNIDTALVKLLISEQFPQWADLTLRPVATSGLDNRTFHLGESMSVRLPSQAHYASQVQKEQTWLPKLAPHLPLAVPEPIAMGSPSKGYPWNWSIYRWLDGETATTDRIEDLDVFAKQLALFLRALQSCDTTDGPIAGEQNFHRGSDLAVYNQQTLQAIARHNNREQAKQLLEIW